ncbi:MAG: GNAT family N-acetyltransferase [Microscillaceae bacterium]|nr:GNAT family N-acetyltransferase [Microscillaceae bacterium]MDW8461964.1 GNAT family N-acetyltransferase [Cytophagales bacterium]
MLIPTEIEVKLAETLAELQAVFAIRHKVFVIEQNVPAEEEYDAFENQARHFIAIHKTYNLPCGTARWRFTDKGIKLERFAVLHNYRSRGVGSAILQKVLQDIDNHPNTKGKLKYLHAQITAMGLYAKFGFRAVGEMFEECAIQHYKMVLNDA